MAKGNSDTIIAAFLLAGMLATAASCGTAGTDRVEPAPLHLKIGRLDRDVFAAADDTTGNSNLRLYAEYGEFYRTYVERILRASAFSDPRLPLALSRFTHDADWVSVQQTADSLLGDMKAQEQGFDAAFGRLKTLFPDSVTPRIIAYNSGFNYGVVPTDSAIGFGVEWFVGKYSPVTAYLPGDIFPAYRRERMRPDLLVPAVVKGWLMAHYSHDTGGEDLLTNLVDRGKVMALLSTLLPDAPDSLLLGYTAQQMQWCKDNEFTIWKEVVGHELLWSKDPKTVDRFMDDGPFTSGFPRESPGHLGEWIGLRMVRSYLHDHPAETFPELIALRDPQAVLKSYKPR